MPPGPMVVPNMLSDDSKPPSPQLRPVDTPGFQDSISQVQDNMVRFSPPGLNMSLPSLATPPETPLVDLNEPYTAPLELRYTCAPVERPASTHAAPAPLTPKENPVSPSPAPQLEVRDAEWQQFWPEVTTVLKHLLQPPSPSQIGRAHV